MYKCYHLGFRKQHSMITAAGLLLKPWITSSFSAHRFINLPKEQDDRKGCGLVCLLFFRFNVCNLMGSLQVGNCVSHGSLPCKELGSKCALSELSFSCRRHCHIVLDLLSSLLINCNLPLILFNLSFVKSNLLNRKYRQDKVNDVFKCLKKA